MTADIVLWLDLAEENQMVVVDDAMPEHVPRGAQILRLTEYGVDRCAAGAPTAWRPVLDAIEDLLRDARKLERGSQGCRYWVTGRAGLPAFFHLGYRLGKFAAVTFAHQSQNGSAVEVMRLDAAHSTPGGPYFERTPWPVPRTDGAAPAALVVSSLRRPSEHSIREAMAKVGGIVRAHSFARLDATTVGSAMREIEEMVQETCDAHPARSALAVFMAGPTSLAFLLGRAINPRACRDVQVFEFDGGRYSLAYELPYPPVPDRNRVLMLMSSAADAPELQLGEEIRALRLGQGAETVRNRLDILDIPAARPRDLLEGIRQHRPGMLHFSGHGQIGELLFQANDGSGRPVLTSEVVEVLRYEGESIRLVVLGACHSESHAHALVAHVGCVVAMRGSVLDADARRFSAVFYRHLAEGDSVQDAFAKARLGTRLERQADPGGPSSRDVTTARAGSGAEEEAPTLSERFDGCAAETFLVRR